MKKKTGFWLIGVALAIILTACNSPQKKTEEKTIDVHESATTEEAHGEKKSDCNDVHWSHHEGHDGPENWMNLCDGFNACGGQAQSPINIVSSKAVANETLKAIEINYSVSSVDIINNGHTVQFNMHGDNSFTIDDKKYDLLQFHYHASSEHTIDGNYYPLEVHFVHKHSDTDYAVIGIMFEAGEENELFAKYLAHFPAEKGSYSADDELNLADLLPDNLSYYYYPGSLTTPPCSEVVNWYVLQKPLTASDSQIEKFSQILNHNFRPVMPLNERILYKKDL